MANALLQKPDGLSDEEWEDMLEEHAERHPHDVWDDLEKLRTLLNSSHLEAMHFLKKPSRFGNQCPYYIKARTVFDRDERAEILSLLDKIKTQLEDNNE